MSEAGFLLTAGTIATYLAILWLPGGLAAAVIGLRGWALAATAPALTYLIAGLAGPWLWALGIRFNALTFGLCVVVFVALCAAARRFVRPPSDAPSPWARQGHVAVALTVLASAAVGVAVLLTAMKGDFAAIPQDWDAAYHANGIRYIADTGEGGLYATGKVNWYEVPEGVFYPNAYHLVDALVYNLTGAGIQSVINANLVVFPGLLALTVAALVRHFNGRAVTAGYAAVASVTATSLIYDNVWRGPLLTFTLGVALMPVLAIVMDRYLRRPALDTGIVFGGVAVSLMLVHTSNLASAVLFVLPLLVQRRRLLRDVRVLILPALAAVLVTLPQLIGAATITKVMHTIDWASNFPVSQSIGTLLTFQHVIPGPQWWLAIPLWIGLMRWQRLGDLRWLLGSAILFGGVWILTASFPQPWVAKATAVWWNDQYRLLTLACVPLCVVVGHGLAQVHDWLSVVTTRFKISRAVPAALVLLMLVVFSKGLYFRINAAQSAIGYGSRTPAHEKVVGPGEVEAMKVLGKLVKPDERVMNDRHDGTLWMYAVSGARPIAGHYDGSLMSPDILALMGRFQDYDTDPQVRAAVKRLNIRYLMVGRGFLSKDFGRTAGLTDIEGRPFLEKVYENPEATVYRLVPPPGEVSD